MEILLSRGAGLKHPQLSVPELLVDSGSTYLQGEGQRRCEGPGSWGPGECISGRKKAAGKEWREWGSAEIAEA